MQCRDKLEALQKKPNARPSAAVLQKSVSFKDVQSESSVKERRTSENCDKAHRSLTDGGKPRILKGETAVNETSNGKQLNSLLEFKIQSLMETGARLSDNEEWKAATDAYGEARDCNRQLRQIAPASYTDVEIAYRIVKCKYKGGDLSLIQKVKTLSGLLQVSELYQQVAPHDVMYMQYYLAINYVKTGGVEKAFETCSYGLTNLLLVDNDTRERYMACRDMPALMIRICELRGTDPAQVKALLNCKFEDAYDQSTTSFTLLWPEGAGSIHQRKYVNVETRRRWIQSSGLDAGVISANTALDNAIIQSDCETIGRITLSTR